jgi:hypothetical protein
VNIDAKLEEMIQTGHINEIAYVGGWRKEPEVYYIVAINKLKKTVKGEKVVYYELSLAATTCETRYTWSEDRLTRYTNKVYTPINRTVVEVIKNPTTFIVYKDGKWESSYYFNPEY